MSLIRTAIALAAVIMLLPVDEKKQADLTRTASATAEQTATFCERNPSTCATGQELWALFLRKAEYGMELGARLLREQIGRSLGAPQQAREAPLVQARANAAPADHHGAAAAPAPTPLRLDVPTEGSRAAQAQRRSGYPMDNSSRWR